MAKSKVPDKRRRKARARLFLAVCATLLIVICTTAYVRQYKAKQQAAEGRFLEKQTIKLAKIQPSDIIEKKNASEVGVIASVTSAVNKFKAGAGVGTAGAAGEEQRPVLAEYYYIGDSESGGELHKMPIFDEPTPDDCHVKYATDFDGAGLVWGVDHKKGSAAQCCQACKDFRPDTDGQYCNIWVWCGHPESCWAPDIHNHTTGTCWLKYQQGWDNNVDLSRSNIVINHRGTYDEEYRNVHKTAPLLNQWTAGLIPAQP